MNGISPSVAEGKALLDAIFVSRMHPRGAGEGAAAFWALGLQKMPLASSGTQHFPSSGYFEALRRGFLRLNALWTSHNSVFFSKRAQTIDCSQKQSKGQFLESLAQLLP